MMKTSSLFVMESDEIWPGDAPVVIGRFPYNDGALHVLTMLYMDDDAIKAPEEAPAIPAVNVS